MAWQSLTFCAVEAFGVAALVYLGVLLPVGLAGWSPLRSVATLVALRDKAQLVKLLLVQERPHTTTSMRKITPSDKRFLHRFTFGNVLRDFLPVCYCPHVTDLRGEAVR